MSGVSREKSRWWRTVHIGSLKLSAWSAVTKTVSLQQVQTIFQTTSSLYLLVVKSLDPLDVVGVISPKSVETAIAANSKDDKTALHKSVCQVDELVCRNFKLMPISGGVIGDLEDAFLAGAVNVILYRTTHILSMVQSNNNEDVGTLERKHVIAIVTRTDLKRWIGEVEGHHNM